MNYNKVILGGHLVRDPESKTIGTGTTVVEFAIAVTEKWRDKASGGMNELTSFIDCSCFGRTGENIAKYFKKGDPILVEGSLQQDRWKTQDGSNRSKVKVKVFTFTFVGGKADTQSRPPVQPPRDTQGPAVKEEDLPF